MPNFMTKRELLKELQDLAVLLFMHYDQAQSLKIELNLIRQDGHVQPPRVNIREYLK